MSMNFVVSHDRQSMPIRPNLTTSMRFIISRHCPCGEYHAQKRGDLLVENIGVEPMTSCVQGRRSSQLS